MDTTTTTTSDGATGTFSVATVEALDRMRTAAVLAAGLAHEVSNALMALNAALDGMAELAASGRAGDVNEDLDLAREAASAITAVVRDFQDYTRTGASRRRGDASGGGRACDARAAVERALRLAGPRLRRVAEVDAQLQPVGLVRAREGAITQIALNLLLNAADALPAAEMSRNRVDVTLARHGEQACLEVTDNGRGIPPGMLVRLFEPLTTTKSGAPDPATSGSSGLGLAICRELTRAFGGQISVQVEPGIRTTFRVLLPADG